MPAIAILLALALISSCTSGPEKQSDASTSAAAEASGRAVVKDGAPTRLAADGLKVTLPAGSLETGTEITVAPRPVAETTAPPPDVTPLTEVFHVSNATDLRHPAQLELDAPASLSRRVRPVVMWTDGEGQWQLLPTQWQPGQDTVTARTAHFSGILLGSLDTGLVAAEVKKSMLAYLTGRMNVAQPTCGDEAGPRNAGVAVTSDQGDTVKWCVGRENNQLLVKVANNRRTFTAIDYPLGWKVKEGTSLALSTDAVARFAGTKYSTTRGRATRIIDGGDTLTLIVPEGQSGRVHAEMSIIAWTVQAAFLAGDIYGRVMTRLDKSLGQEAGKIRGTIERLLTGRGEDELTGALRTCTTGVGEAYNTADENGYVTVLKFVAKCVPDYLTTLLQKGASLVRALALATLSLIVSSVLTAANLIVSGGREAFDTAVSFGGKDDPLYNIWISQADPNYLADGSYHAFISEAAGNRLTADVVVWFTGEEALAACAEDDVPGPETDTICNEYYIRNENPNLRELTLSSAATLAMPEVPGGFESLSASFAELPERIDAVGGQFLARIQVRNGLVTSVAQQYRP